MPALLQGQESESAWSKSIQQFVAKYNEDVPSSSTMPQELDMWYSKWVDTRAPIKELKEAYLSASTSICFPNVAYLLKVLLTVPVTSAGAERANSTLKFIKTSVRPSMKQETLNCLVLGYKHKDLLANITEGELVDRFVRIKRRRLLLANPMDE